MEFSTAQPPSLGPYQYEAEAVLTLDAVGHDSEEGNLLTRTLSRGSVGSQGRRSSVGSQGGRRPSFGADPEHGGGLRKAGRRKSLDAAQAKAVMLQSPGADVSSTPAAAASPPPVPAEVAASSKWTAKVVIGVTPTHLIIVLPPPSTLAPYSSVTHSAFFGSSSSSNHPSIGDKIKGFLRRGSKTDTEDSAQSPTATDPAAAAPVPLAYPSYINGDPVTHVLVPIADIVEESCKLVEDKNQIGLRLKVDDRATLILGSMGAAIDQSTSRKGSIKFKFNKQWLGAKAEAEVLLHAIHTAVENKKNGIATADAALGHAQAGLRTESGARRVSNVGTEASGAKVEG